ncbi:hypothetical protein [Actinomadura sp. 9N215]|uniref:hypothetical protein n=1 Tax=Actinomadura sp. 9N215 TaxID=3375150 RepID=UPI0037AC4EB3
MTDQPTAPDDLVLMFELLCALDGQPIHGDGTQCDGCDAHVVPTRHISGGVLLRIVHDPWCDKAARKEAAR